MSTPKKVRSSKHIREAIRPIKPEMDIQGVVARNDQYINVLIGLRSLLPQISTNVEGLRIVAELIDDFGVIPKNLASLNLFDRKMASHAAKLYLILKKDWNKATQSDVKRALKVYVDKVKAMGEDLSMPRAQPRNMKEVLARNFLGIQPQDTRTRGLGHSYMKETLQDFKVLFGADNNKAEFKKAVGDEEALEKSKRNVEMRRLQEEAYEDNRDFDAVRQHKQQRKQQEMGSVHEEALRENRIRDNALFAGNPIADDPIRDKELIHAQALEMDGADEVRDEQRNAEEQRNARRIAAERASVNKIEDNQDDSVSSDILEELKSIHELLEEKPTNAKTKTQENNADTREDEIQKIMKALGYKGNNPDGRKLAEKMLDSGTKKGPVEPVSPRDEDHEKALKINQDIDRKKKEESYIHDKDVAHAEALEVEKEKVHGRALSTNAKIDYRMKEKNFIKDKDEAHDRALKVNADIDQKNASPPVPTAAQPAAPQPTQVPEETPEPVSLMDRARGMLGGVKRFAGMAARGLGMASIAAGGVVGGWKLGGWANRRLGLQTVGERMNEAENARSLEVDQNAANVARQHGFNSFAEMQAANRATSQRNLQRQSGMVDGVSRGNIDDTLSMTPTMTPPPSHVTNNYVTPAPAPQHSSEPQVVFIRPVHPSLMRFQDKRVSRTLFPQNTM